ncbi:hypothetical protein BHE18_15000 [Rossellomorea aquimaris]|uniref:Uncharacterized protein n=2 Tax=Rossellomorea aquimaris TaxID=189382 RepID=A0A1J6W4U5_9BACI|nr:hypothetical protein BHE18_15000 [Rossellomorea aquimaris]
MRRGARCGTRGQVRCPGFGRERVAGTGTLARLEWFIFKKEGEMMGMFMTKAAVEAGDSFLEEGRKMSRLLIDLMGAADVREDGLGFVSYGEIWRACCERGMFL